MSRDTDSSISTREDAAIREWLRYDKNFHVLRDHPGHCIPMLGGNYLHSNAKVLKFSRVTLKSDIIT